LRGVRIIISWNLFIFKRCGSPVTIYLDLEAKAQESIQLSSKSSLTTGGIWTLGKISDISKIPAISSFLLKYLILLFYI
jgi:hypothetical protein